MATVPVGSSVNVTCQATGFPAPEILWKRDGAVTQGDGVWSETAAASGNLLVTTSVLTLDDMEVSDEGQYVCVAVTDLFADVEKIVKTIIVYGKH